MLSLWETPVPDDSGPWPQVEARSREFFADVLEIVRPEVLVEFGSWEGASALAWATQAQSLGLPTHVVCIDTWLGSPEHWRNVLPGTEWARDHLRLDAGQPGLINTFRHAVHAHGMQEQISPLRATSECGSEYLRALGVAADVVYVDANHDYYAVAQDLRFANSILSSRGVIAGDDWAHPPIQRAVLEFAALKRQEILISRDRVSFVLLPKSRAAEFSRQFAERGFAPMHVGTLAIRVAKMQTRAFARRVIKGPIT